MKFRVINTTNLEDVSAFVSSFELQQKFGKVTASMILNGQLVELQDPRAKQKKEQYSIYLADSKGNEWHQILERI